MHLNSTSFYVKATLASHETGTCAADFHLRRKQTENFHLPPGSGTLYIESNIYVMLWFSACVAPLIAEILDPQQRRSAKVFVM